MANRCLPRLFYAHLLIKLTVRVREFYNLLRGTAFYKGKVVAEEEKTGFTNKGQLVALLVKRLPKDIPTGAIVQFVIENMDKGGKWMYEHQKGKGFH